MIQTPFLSVAELATILDLTPSRVYQLARSGLLPTVRVTPGRIRIPRAAFEQWLALQCAKALDRVAS